jgi:hypothetical protein
MNENPFVSNCPPNHFCGQTMQNGPTTCVAACDPNNLEEYGCEDGLTCRVAFEGLDAFGLCL